MPEEHSGENLAESIKRSLKYWELNLDNLRAITTDNAANMLSACKQAKLNRIQCFGHR